MHHFYSLSGYATSDEILCVDCAYKEYAGRVDSFRSPYGSYDNRRAIVAGVKRLADSYPSASYARFTDQYGYGLQSDGTIGGYVSLPVRNMRNYKDAFVDSQAFGGAKVLDHDGMPLTPITDGDETDSREYCQSCNAEIETIIVCHADNKYSDWPCDCDECRAALVAEAALPEARAALHAALVAARAARCAGAVPADLYDAIHDRADDLSTLLSTARKRSQLARCVLIGDRAFRLWLWAKHPDTGNDPYSYANWANRSGGYANGK